MHYVEVVVKDNMVQRVVISEFNTRVPARIL